MEEVKERLRQLFNSNVIDPNRRSEFDLFNVSVSQKIWSAQRYYKEIADLNINSFKWSPYENGVQTESSAAKEYQPEHTSVVHATDTQYTGAIASHMQVINIPAYCRQLNFLLAGFFMNSTSALDTLAHHITILYTLDQVPDKLYIWNVSKMLYNYHPDSKVRNILEKQIPRKKQLQEDWFQKLREYRDCTTHQNLIPYDMRWKQSSWSVEHEAPEITLSDAPKKWPPTSDEKREPVSYCGFILTKVRSLVKEIYESILLDVEDANNILPIPKT